MLKDMEKTRTTRQNNVRSERTSRALHLMFDQLASELNDRGMYISQVIRFDAPWDGRRVKELIWREVQKKMTGKKSTTELTSREIDEIFEVIHKALSEKGIEIVFPSIESLSMDMRLQEEKLQ